MNGFVTADAAQLAVRALQHERGMGVGEIARYLQMDRRTIQRLFGKRRLRSDAADRLAIALGRHPCELWPNWFEERPPRSGAGQAASQEPDARSSLRRES